MRNSKLWKIYQSLSPKEVSQIVKFLKSPYFNKRNDVIDLFDALGNMNLNGNLEEREIHLHIWPSHLFDKQRLTYTMSFLVDLILQYFVHEDIKRDRIKKLDACSELLHDRRLDDVFNHAATKLTREIDQMLESTSKYKLAYETLQIRKENFYRKELYSEISLNEINLSLDEYYLLEKLRIYIEAESLASRQADTFRDPIRTSVLSIIQKHKEILSPLIRLYLSVYEVLTSDGEIAAFRQARQLLKSIESEISQHHL